MRRPVGPNRARRYTELGFFEVSESKETASSKMETPQNR